MTLKYSGGHHGRIVMITLYSLRGQTRPQWNVNIVLKTVSCVNSVVIFFPRLCCDAAAMLILFSRKFSRVLHKVCVYKREGRREQGRGREDRTERETPLSYVGSSMWPCS